MMKIKVCIWLRKEVIKFKRIEKLFMIRVWILLHVLAKIHFVIPCRHILGYLVKVQEVDYLPQQYILNRWTKAAKSAAVKDLGGLEITDTNALVVKWSKLFHHASLLIDKVLTSPDEASTIFIEALDNVLNKLKEMQVDKGESACVRKKPSDVFQHRYNEPNQVRAKGCGKGLKKGKRQTKRKITSNGRKCHGCGLHGQLHDKRNCPALEENNNK